jgi:hypothetical protein
MWILTVQRFTEDGADEPTVLGRAQRPDAVRLMWEIVGTLTFANAEAGREQVLEPTSTGGLYDGATLYTEGERFGFSIHSNIEGEV